jgi:hypothetical protein
MSQLTTYGSVINSRASFTKRTQSLTKINNLGFGVIYYWHWGWSFSPHPVGGQKKEELKQAAKDGSIPYNSSNEEAKSGRFMYLGLAVQLPTMVRIKAHLEQANESNPNNTKALALAQGIKQNLTTTGSDGVISDPKAIPHIIHICSLFDLAPLESYYVEVKYKLNQSGKGRSFLDIIQNGNVSHSVGGVPTIGVNTEAEGAEAAGQGSPIKQGDVRGTPEWIMAAYWFLSETDSTVLAARNTAPYFFGKIASQAKKEKTMTKKVLKIFELFGKDKNVSSNVAAKFNSITEDQIAGILKIMGVSEKSKLDGLSESEYIKDEKNLKQNFSIDKFLGDTGKLIEASVSFDLSTSKKDLTETQKFILTKDKVSTELRTVLVNYITQIESSDFGEKSSEKIISKLTIDFQKGLSNMELQIIELINKANQVTKQSIQSKNKFDKELKKAQKQNTELPRMIENTMGKLNTLLRKTLESVAYEAGVKALEQTLNSIPVNAKVSKKIVGLKMAEAKKKKEKNIEQTINQGVKELFKVYSGFQKLQSALNKIAQGQAEALLKEIDESL